jgi:hypothetical protein
MLFATNRDEMVERPWKPPARHWPDRPKVIAGLDELGGGSWFGLNDHRVVAGILNRRGTLGPTPGKRSRGLLVLAALDHADAVSAANAIANLDAASYRSFNLVIADSQIAFWLWHSEVDGRHRIEAMELSPGVSMLTEMNCNDPGSARIHRYLPCFRTSPAPDPEADDWSAWEALLACTETDAGPAGAMNVVTNLGFGTLCSALLALPARDCLSVPPRFRFAAGRPDVVPYREVAL